MEIKNGLVGLFFGLFLFSGTMAAEAEIELKRPQADGKLGTGRIHPRKHVSSGPAAYSTSSPSAVYLVFTTESGSALYHRVLSSALGSEESAKEALIYEYHNIKGFAALLTPKQVNLLKKQPEVLEVQPSKRLSLFDSHDGGGQISEGY